MLEDDILAIEHCDEKFYVDKNKILYILSLINNCNAFLLSEKEVIELVLSLSLLNKDLFVKINKA